MIQYILECIAFQLAFLVIYDFFLKKETFFQWNRVYLIGTYLLSLVLPWIKIEALETSVSEQYYVYPEFLWNTNSAVVAAAGAEPPAFQFYWQEGVLYGGMLLAALYFAYKLYRLEQLRKQGITERFPDFTRIVLKNSELAFSFFRSIFLGDKILSKEHESIIQHELVHIKQKHSLDLVFFELMRIVGWFNPLVYLYQNRISELHEFIADAQVPKTERRAHYDLLLSQVFQTQNISFVNQFYKKSLIKKRIVMLQKAKSKKIFQLKYLLLVPLVFGMLAYTSCDLNESNESKNQLETIMVVSDIDKMTKTEEEKLFSSLKSLSDKGGDWKYELKDGASSIFYESSINDSFIKFEDYDEKIYATMLIQGPSIGKGKAIMKDTDGTMIPFGQIDEVPVFPGCEDAENKRACFNEMIQQHIAKNFKYPKEAQEKGIQGRVHTLFTIGKDGVVKNLKMRGPDPLLENETERMINLLPMMQPGKQKGKEVNVPYSIPITFKLMTTETASDAAPTTTVSSKIYVVASTYMEGGKRFIKGVVSDGQKGLPGVNIEQSGSFSKIVTDFNGAFVTAANTGDKLVLQYLNLPLVVLEISDETEYKATENDVLIGLPDNEKPTYFIDGVETTMEYIQTIDAEAIASVAVLKGKSAQGKYGEKGKNGVIEITLKKKE